MLSNPKHIELKLPRGIMFEGDDDHDSTEEDESDDQGWDFSKRIRDSRIQGEKERESTWRLLPSPPCPFSPPAQRRHRSTGPTQIPLVTRYMRIGDTSVTLRPLPCV